MGRDIQQDSIAFEAGFRRFVLDWQRAHEKALSGIAASHFRAMVEMRDSGPLTMGDVARALGATLGGATGFVDHAVKAGFAERVYDPADRRIVRVRLTPKGREATDRVTVLMVAHARQALERLTDDERTKLVDLWGKLVGDPLRDVAPRPNSPRAIAGGAS